MGKMEKLGPGSDADTLKVLAMVPGNGFRVIVDAGCGVGRQTVALARQLQTPVHGIDTSEAYLERLGQRAQDLGIGHLVETHCLDMADIPGVFPEIDLLWSECAAYNIGFPRALAAWLPALRPGGCAVVSELSWLGDDIPPEVQEYFQSSYPAMRGVDENRSLVRAAGYDLIATHVLSREAWVEGYYDVLEPAARSLLNHPDKSVRDFAGETLKSIGIFNYFGDCFGYVFYVMQKP